MNIFDTNEGLMQKENKLEKELGIYDNSIVAFSGGIDSTFLLYKTIKVLGKENVLAVTAASELMPQQDLEESQKLAAKLEARHKIVETNELENHNFIQNPPERCYYCKNTFYGQLVKIAGEENFRVIMDGSNWEDKIDYRPGAKAAQEHGVISPLQKHGFTKKEIRFLSRKYGLPNWNKPSEACLASRFPYGEKIARDKLNRVEQAEKALKQMGFTGNMRVRSHGDMARLEVFPENMQLLLQQREDIVKEFHKLGFVYITLDLEGFTSGSMNRALNNNSRNGV